MRMVLIVGTLTVAAMAGGTAAEAAEARIASFAFACTTPEGETLKPKFGDIDGIFYTDLPDQREQCLEAVQRKIALCRENVDFESTTKNEIYAPCLPIFAEQADACVGHFTFERGKCDAGEPGAETADQAEDEVAPEESYSVAPLDAVMEVTARANVRSGPGTGHNVLGTLEAGVGVRVTGAVEGGEWLRVDLREDDGAAFIHASLLKEMASETPEAPLEPFGPNWIVAENQPCQLQKPYPPAPGDTVTWTGPCVDGKASGEGRYVWRHSDGVDTYEGSMRDGWPHGHGTETWAIGGGYEGDFRNGWWHGHGTMTWANGDRYEGSIRYGWPHGQGTMTWANGHRYEGEWRDGYRHGHGTFTWADGDAMTCEWRDNETVDGTCSYH